MAKDKGMMTILDDKEARAIGKSWGLERTGTVMVLHEAFIKEVMTYDELVEDLGNLARVMWLSPDVITEIIKRAKKVRG